MIITAETCRLVLEGGIPDSWEVTPKIVRAYKPFDVKRGQEFWADFRKPFATLMGSEEKILWTQLSLTPHGQKWLEEFYANEAREEREALCTGDEKPTADAVSPTECGR